MLNRAAPAKMHRMANARASFFKQAVRQVLLPLFAWLLVAQSVVLPLAKANAIELRGTDAALSILCARAFSVPAPGEDHSNEHHLHDQGCCTLCARAGLLPPLGLAAQLVSFEAPVRVPSLVAREGAPSHGPPPIAQRTLQPRAPPILA